MIWPAVLRALLALPEPDAIVMLDAWRALHARRATPVHRWSVAAIGDAARARHDQSIFTVALHLEADLVFALSHRAIWPTATPEGTS